MVMMERFGSPATRWMSVMKSFQVPVRSIQLGDRILVITDDAMDPLVWQGAMAAINESETVELSALREKPTGER